VGSAVVGSVNVDELIDPVGVVPHQFAEDPPKGDPQPEPKVIGIESVLRELILVNMSIRLENQADGIEDRAIEIEEDRSDQR